MNHIADYRYRTICSCCSAHVSKEALELPDNNDTEGNLCMQCYGEAQLSNWFEMQEMFDLVTKSLTNPFHLLRWKYDEPYLKWHYCQKMMEKGILTWKIK